MILALSLAALAQEPPEEPVARRYAVVVGISTYESLPAELMLPAAHGDAARVALALREEANYDDVRLITDSEATKERLERLFREELAPLVTYRDTVLVYFVGQGVGADFDDPYLLTYDTSADDLPGTSLSVSALGESLPEWLQAGSYALVTDAAHGASLGDLALVGPVASSWPDVPNTYHLSATSLGETGFSEVFAKHFIDAITGGADTTRDNVITPAELYRYLVIAVPRDTGSRQNPSQAGHHDHDLALSTGIQFKDTLGEGGEPMLLVVKETVEVPSEVIVIREHGDTTEVLPTHTVDKVKFVMKGLASPTVTCRDAAPLVCDPTCYAREVKAGPCQVTGFDGTLKLKGSVFVAARGVYECEPVDGVVECSSPNWRGD
ncbi:MAG TPA: caspase family protein [Myxococcota bacterium]|nr:caspase family protein [Myxococcota bacterium]